MKLLYVIKYVNLRKVGNKKFNIKWFYLCKILEIFCGLYLKLKDWMVFKYVK